MQNFFFAACFFMLMVSNVYAADTAVIGDAVAGKATFERVCLYCHTSNEDSKFGPSLKHVGERRSETWLHAWLKNPAEMIKNDVDAKVVRGNNKYDMTMPALPAMQDEQKRADVVAYLLRDF